MAGRFALGVTALAISLDVIEREIDRLETKETTYYVCERLACLYAVRDHMTAGGDKMTEATRGSDFLEACSGVSYAALMRVLDEHMEAIKLLYPKSYESLMQRIRALKD